MSEAKVYVANVLYHQNRLSVAQVARQLKCSWATANRLITHDYQKWVERQRMTNELPLHFAECLK